MMRTASILVVLLIAPLASAQTFEVYVSDAGNFDRGPWQILKFDGNGENPSVFIDSNLNWPQDILFLEDSNTVLISSLGSGRITKHDASTGAFIGNFATGIGGPTRMKIGPDSLLYVLQWSGNGKVRRYDLNGTFLGDFTSIGVAQSIGLDWDSAGNLYVSSYTGDLVVKFDRSGESQGTFISSNLVGPTNIWFDAKGDLLVSDYDGTALKRFDSSGNYLGDFITGLRNSEGVDFFPNGDILIGNGGTRSVKQFDRDGHYLKEFIPRGSGNLLIPNAIVIRQLPDPIPGAPDELVATLVCPRIDLVWSDNADHEDGFRVYRQTDGGSRDVIATLSANVTRYSDTAIETGHRYEYSVSSFNENGESEVSDMAIVTAECDPAPVGPRRRAIR